MLNWAGPPPPSQALSLPHPALPARYPPGSGREAGGEGAAEEFGVSQSGALTLISPSNSRLGDHGPNSALTAPARESGVWSL